MRMKLRFKSTIDPQQTNYVNPFTLTQQQGLQHRERRSEEKTERRRRRRRRRKKERGKKWNT